MKASKDPDVVLLQAAADPIRLSILRQLSSEGPVCACDFAVCSEVRQPTVSHHLKVLREAGWISGERRGTWIWYALRPEAVERFRDLAARIRPSTARTVATLRGSAISVPVPGDDQRQTVDR